MCGNVTLGRCCCWRRGILNASTRWLRCLHLPGYLGCVVRNGTDNRALAGVLLLDSIGELASLYQFADIAFIGGSLVPRGGHNVLEPAYFGVPILVGPHTENFRDIIEIFRRADALRVVTPESLTETMLGLLSNEADRDELGRNAKRVMTEQQGTTQRTVEALLSLLAIAPAATENPLAVEWQG